MEEEDGSLKYNGYYTWPRMGFEAEMYTKIVKLHAYRYNYASDGRYNGIDLTNVKNISDLMNDKIGRRFWKEFGTTLRNSKVYLEVNICYP